MYFSAHFLVSNHCAAAAQRFSSESQRTNDWAPKTTELWSNVRMRQASKGKHSAQWFWKAKNRQKLNSFLCHFTSFSIKFYQIDIYFGIPWTSFILKSCQTVVGIWTVCHFHEFLWSNLWQVFAFWPNCAVVRSTRQQAWRQAERRRLSAAAPVTGAPAGAAESRSLSAYTHSPLPFLLSSLIWLSRGFAVLHYGLKSYILRAHYNISNKTYF